MVPQTGAILYGEELVPLPPGFFSCDCKAFYHHMVCAHTLAVRGTDSKKPGHVNLDAMAKVIGPLPQPAKRRDAEDAGPVGGSENDSDTESDTDSGGRKEQLRSRAAVVKKRPRGEKQGGRAAAGIAPGSWWRVEGGGGDTARVDAALETGNGSEVLAVASSAAAIEFKKAANPSAIPLSTTCILPLKRFSRSTN